MNKSIIPSNQPDSGNNSDPQFFTFHFGSYEIRAYLDAKRNPWFIAGDLCEALGLGNITRALDRLDDDEKGFTTSNTLGGAQTVLTVNQSGMYSLILTSRKPEAKAFKKWVTSEVIPEIVNTGSYQTKGLTPIEGFKQWLSLYEAQETRIAQMESKVTRIDAQYSALLDGSDYYTVIGYVNLRRLRPPTPNESQSLGKQATRLSKERDVKIGKANDPRWGPIGTYHVSILDSIFEGWQ